MFLNCLHRNLIATGYWTAEAVAAGGAAMDTITEAHWPVVDRVLRRNAAQFLEPIVITEWTVGLGLLSFGAIREANRLAEEIRDNSLSMEVDSGGGQRASLRSSKENLGGTVLIACLVAAVLAALRWGVALAQPVQRFAIAAAYAALVALFWVVAKTS